jgi:hypothetical protein
MKQTLAETKRISAITRCSEHCTAAQAWIMMASQAICTHLVPREGAEDQLDLAHVCVKAKTAGRRANKAQVEAHVAVAGRLGGVIGRIEAVLDAEDTRLGVGGHALKAGRHADDVVEDDTLAAQVHEIRVILGAKNEDQDSF